MTSDATKLRKLYANMKRLGTVTSNKSEDSREYRMWYRIWRIGCNCRPSLFDFLTLSSYKSQCFIYKRFLKCPKSYFSIDYVNREVFFSTVESINFPHKLLTDFTTGSISERKLNSLYGLCTVLQINTECFFELPKSCKCCYFHIIFRLSFSTGSFSIH